MRSKFLARPDKGRRAPALSVSAGGAPPPTPPSTTLSSNLRAVILYHLRHVPHTPCHLVISGTELGLPDGNPRIVNFGRMQYARLSASSTGSGTASGTGTTPPPVDAGGLARIRREYPRHRVPDETALRGGGGGLRSVPVLFTVRERGTAHCGTFGWARPPTPRARPPSIPRSGSLSRC